MKIDFSTWILARPSFQISYLEQEETHSTTVIKTDTDECQFTDHVYDDGDDGPEKYFLISKANTEKPNEKVESTVTGVLQSLPLLQTPHRTRCKSSCF